MRAGRPEVHRMQRIGWLRAAVMGANDGILSTASIVVGVAAAASTRSNILLSGIAALVAGALSMAAGEYVSVSSQADIERADLSLEGRELAADPDGELHELMSIYVARGLDPELAARVAAQLTANDALGAHAREELGFSASHTARPIQAAVASAVAFSAGAALPLLTAFAAPAARIAVLVSATSLVFLALLGGLAARAGGADVFRGIVRVTFWGALAMTATAAVGSLFGTIV